MVIYGIFWQYIASKWHQDSPYNNLCPIIGSNRALAGCVATAVIQIMYHHGHPSSYNGYSFNWTEMRKHTNTGMGNYPSAHTIIAQIMQQLELSMSYGASESGPYSENGPRTFKNFGFSN